MKRFFAYTLLTVLTVLLAIGREQADSVSVYFSINRSKINPLLRDNAASLDSILSLIRVAYEEDNLQSVTIRAYASPEGPARSNERLARKRTHALAEYILRHTNITPELIKQSPEGEAWSELYRLVMNTPGVPSRKKVLEILEKVNSAESSYKNGGGYETQKVTKDRLASLDRGRPYRWMLDHLYPRLRNALAIVVSLKDSVAERRDTLAQLPILTSSAIDTIRLVVTKPEQLVPQASLPLTEYPPVEPRHRLALKTNFLYYAAIMPNIELEWLIRDHWSVAADWDIAWWGSSSRNQIYRLSVVSAEGRYWIAPRSPWHGIYVGVFAGGGWYDLLHGQRTGYYGEGVMSGVSLGYMWPVGRNLSLEVAAGGGYMFSNVKEYLPFEGHHVYKQTKALSYFGPLKVKFSLVWRFWDTNKSKRKKGGL